MTPELAGEPFWYDMLPRMGSTAEFAAMRGVFADAGFDYESVCRRLGVEHIYLFRPEMVAPLVSRPVTDALDALLRLYVLGYWLEEDAILRLLGRAAWEAGVALSLLRRHGERPEMWFSPVLVMPVPGALAACDRYSGPDGGDLKSPPPDIVYLPVFQGTIEYVARLPETPCDAMLEIGTGAGSAVIRAARFARQVWATDITERSVHFAAFNCGLAGLENVCVVKGDLYEPVEGLTFDRIASHPPYVPSRESKTVFREGGEDGEQIVQRIVAGLPRFLRPNGQFWGLWMASDRRGERMEQRLRKWLGASEAEFDIGVAVDSLRTPSEALAYSMSKGSFNPEELVFLRELWRANDTEGLVHASVLIRRHAGARPAVTVRSQTGRGFAGHHLERLLDWEAAIHGPSALEMLLELRPALSAECQLQTRYLVKDGKFVPDDFQMEAAGPLKNRCKCPAWLAQMVSECDGTRTVRDWFEVLRAEGRIPREAVLADFVGMVAALIGSGLLMPRGGTACG